MSRITRADEHDVTQFKLKGKLSWVEALEQSWRQAVADSAGHSLVVHLTGVAYVDTGDTDLLIEMHPHGAELTASSYLAKSIVEEMKARSRGRARAEH